MIFHIYFVHLTPLHLAVSHDQIEIIKLLLDRDDIDVNAVDSISNNFFIKFLYEISWLF